MGEPPGTFCSHARNGPTPTSCPVPFMDVTIMFIFKTQHIAPRTFSIFPTAGLFTISNCQPEYSFVFVIGVTIDRLASSYFGFRKLTYPSIAADS